MSVLAEVLLALGTIMLISTVTVVVLVRLVYTRIRRSRAVGDSVLRARARLSVGRQHELLTLRLRLADTIASGRAALDLAGRSGAPQGDLRRLFERISSEGAALDAQLLLLLSERDAVVLAEAVPAAGRRVEQIRALVRRLRSAVAAGIGDLTDDTLAALSDDVDHEIAALDAGVRELHELNGRTGRGGAGSAGYRTSMNPLTGRSES
ncbi:hypothetical protein BJQ94_10250 [Cryobacterium sp. SO2]|uniref:hypothetical protein n=1 Tax=Cryobacterium sp. SO2 TaxID=1897060 RepID=UPI00223DE4C5|nr:hypothetical protein [Cryobacterium sp. SO2]WEO75771.1 hypothetical protein BJQ94_10250 [Cryobacterium sp. SO2]